MLECGGDLDLAQEALGAERGGEVGPENLDGHLALVTHVEREVHGGHATAANLALDLVAAAEGRAEALELVGHVAGAFYVNLRSNGTLGHHGAGLLCGPAAHFSTALADWYHMEHQLGAGGMATVSGNGLRVEITETLACPALPQPPIRHSTHPHHGCE
jgi:hypothetical protein